MSIEQAGELSILNCGAGDIRITFDKASETEVAKAKDMIKDMLRRGYAIFIETPTGTRRVKRFNPETEVYVVHDLPDPGEKRTAKTSNVPMRRAKATSVGRTAGG